MRLYWYNGNEEGWTDDLGIIADRNQWIKAQPAGWYLTGHNDEVHKWCLGNLKSYNFMWTNPFTCCIDNEDDITLFKLRWA